MQAHRVLVVDVQPVNATLVRAQLKALDCDVECAADGESALAMLQANPPDLVLLDVQMPGLDGFEVCRRIKTAPEARLLPVVMMTALNAVEDRVAALEAGADDFLAKPVAAVELRARVKSMLRLKDTYDRLDDTERVIYALARAVEAKDIYTEAHTLRVAERAVALGAAAGLTSQELDHLHRGGLLHDIGKIGVPDQILQKPGPLDAGEVVAMQQHPVIGEEIARPLRSAAPLLAIIRHHHERVDGAGYPDSLAGTDIPLLARIVAIADGYDAITSDRPYRPGRSRAEAGEILKAGAGSQWDLELVRLFLEHVDGNRP
jgi:putative two-component system response regulator